MNSEVELIATADAPRRARHWVAEQLSPRSAAGAEAALLVSEIVTDVITAGHTGEGEKLRLVASRVSGHLRVEMSQVGSSSASSTSASGVEDSASSLAFKIVDRVAQRWGRSEENGTSVWFEVRLPGAAAALSMADDLELLERAAQDPESKELIFRRYEKLASQISRRYRGKGIDADDLEQVASIGLIKAIQRFDPEAGAFAAFAAVTIAGELKRHLRDRAWSVRVPRSIQEAALNVTSAEAQLTQKFGRSPTAAELAQATDLTLETVLEARQAGAAFRSVSFDAPVGNDDSSMTLLDRYGEPDEDLKLAERWEVVQPALEKLPTRLRKILYLRFYRDMTQTEIAQVIGVSQMHVSRLLTRALERLRELTDDPGEG
jgi:RNA polymerase sigma-B factor